VLYQRTGGHRPPRPIKTRNATKYFNNEWQKGRYLQVENLGFVEACEQRGIQVLKPEAIFTSHLPVDPEPVPTDLGEPTVKGPFSSEQEHPYFHERPIRDYSLNGKSFPNQMELDCAKLLLKTVEVESGLPGRLVQAYEELNLPSDVDHLVKNVLMESNVFDAKQVKLPKNIAPLYIGWDPVEDKMFRPLPYPIGKISWGRNTRREYGIPEPRKNMNMTRGFMRICDMMSNDRPSLLGRMHMEKTVIRQFLERKGELLRFYVNTPHVVTDTRALAPYADQQVVKSTENIQLPDISPLEPDISFKVKYVYNDQVNFPLKPLHSVACARHHVHTGIQHHLNPFRASYEAREIDSFPADRIKSKALVNGFLLALGQAKLTFGEDVKGDLPSPITVNFVSSDGKQFLFSAFQLNTLDLDQPEGVKNIYWAHNKLDFMYSTCGYVRAIPTLEHYNPEVFKRFAAHYLENS